MSRGLGDVYKRQALKQNELKESQSQTQLKLQNSRHSTRTRYELKLSLIHISEPTRHAQISYAVFCLKK
ncbi:hypothetical protein JMUB7527_28550 [Staphylococcus aureus]